MSHNIIHSNDAVLQRKLLANWSVLQSDSYNIVDRRHKEPIEFKWVAISSFNFHPISFSQFHFHRHCHKHFRSKSVWKLSPQTSCFLLSFISTMFWITQQQWQQKGDTTCVNIAKRKTIKAEKIQYIKPFLSSLFSLLFFFGCNKKIWNHSRGLEKRRRRLRE